MAKIKKIINLLLCLIFILPLTSYSQNPPPSAQAGQVEKSLQEMETRELTSKKRRPKEAPIKEEEAPKEEPADDGTKILIKEFTFEGNTIFKSAYLQKVVSPYKNKELTLTDLRKLCNKITDIYKKDGYFVSYAYLPVQDIKNQIVKISVLEGKLGEVTIDGGKFYKKNFLTSHFHATQKGLMHYPTFLKSLLLLNEYLKLNAQAYLKPGKKMGEVDVVINTVEKMPIAVSFDYNNGGSRYISRSRGGTAVEMGNYFLQGDKLTIRGIKGYPTRNMIMGSGEYSITVNSYGSKLLGSYMWTDFNVQREYRSRNMGGQSRIYTVKFNHPFIKNLATSLEGDLSFDYKDILNYDRSATSSDDQLRILGTRLSGDHSDSLGGRTFFTSGFSLGIDDIMGASRQNNPKASRTDAGGKFVKWDFDVSRFQKFFCDTMLVMRTAGQTASEALPIAEEFAIGGDYSVRGYPPAEYVGDHGYLASFEWRVHLPFIANKNIPFLKRTIRDTIQFLGFSDYGRIILRKPTSNDAKAREISSAGCGVRLDFGNDFNAKIEVGFPMGGGNKPSDGSHCTTHITVTKRF